MLIGWGYGRAPPDLMVEREIDGGLNSRAPTGPYGRAPKGPLQFTYLVGGLLVEHLKVMAASRACFRILSSPLLSLMVEHLKVMAASRACFRILISRAP